MLAYCQSNMMAQQRGVSYTAEKGFCDSNSENEVKLWEVMMRIMFLCKVMKQIILNQK